MSRVEVTAAPPGIVTAVGPLAGGAIAAIVQQAAKKRKAASQLEQNDNGTQQYDNGTQQWVRAVGL